MAWELGLYRPLKDLLSWLWHLRSKPDPAERLKVRARWKAEFEAHHQYLKGQDLIIRDIAGMDSYPQIAENEKGISSWFKLEFKSLYHRGFEALWGSKPSSTSKSTTGGPSVAIRNPMLSMRIGSLAFATTPLRAWIGTGTSITRVPTSTATSRKENEKSRTTTSFSMTAEMASSTHTLSRSQVTIRCLSSPTSSVDKMPNHALQARALDVCLDYKKESLT